MKIDGLDFTFLEEYQRIVMENKTPVPEKPGIIAKPTLKPRKKRLSPLWIIGSAVLVGGVVAALLLSKKKPEKVEVDANYDTRVLGIEWVQITAGEFLMGDNFNEGENDELPVHTVYLSEYYISKYEVTFAQYDTFCQETQWDRPQDYGWGRGNRPVIYVSWSDAKQFCEWLSQKTGKKFNLPSEAQWEKAARDTEQPRYPWGDSPPTCTIVNYGCDQQTHPVGSHPEGVSPYGVHDMAGNVSEWCLDNYNAPYYSSSPTYNPVYITSVYPSSVTYVIRGGSWDSSAGIGIRAADRSTIAYYIDSRGPTLGFRLVWQRQ
jgi:formylglycine-generating enzyme required for sulfatase activity